LFKAPVSSGILESQGEIRVSGGSGNDHRSLGYCNNPFTVNAEGPNKDPRVEAAGTRLALRWFYDINDPAIMRLMTPQPMRRPSDPPSPPPQPRLGAEDGLAVPAVWPVP
jgi:hypothetical protein